MKKLKKIRKGLEDLKPYKEFPDMYKLKLDLDEGVVKAIWKTI